MESNIVCNVPHLGTCWFNKNAIANIISLVHMTEKFHMIYDSAIEKAFKVHYPNKIVKLCQMKSGAYALHPQDNSFFNVVQSCAQLANAIAENLHLILPRQQERAKRAQHYLKPWEHGQRMAERL
eukprot:8368804-Ditylum_brightwellii.AAC.1